MPPHPTRSKSECLETPLQDIECCILITIQDQPTVWAGVGACAQRLFNHRSAARTHFAGIAGVDQDDRSASFCRFADGHTDELSPRYVHDALSHPFASSHFLWCE